MNSLFSDNKEIDTLTNSTIQKKKIFSHYVSCTKVEKLL